MTKLKRSQLPKEVSIPEINFRKSVNHITKLKRSPTQTETWDMGHGAELGTWDMEQKLVHGTWNRTWDMGHGNYRIWIRIRIQ